MMNKRSRFEFLGHAFMFFLLVLIVTLYVKNNYAYSSNEFSYVIALTLPLIALVILLTALIFFNYVIKLADSHRTQYLNLTMALFFVAIMFVAFSILLGVYFSDPIGSRDFLYFSVIPFYLALIVLFVFLIYVCPVLWDRRVVNLPTYLKFMMGVYLVFFLLYPIIFLVTTAKYDEQSNEEEVKKNPNSYQGQKVYNHSPDNDDSAAIFVPFIVVVFFHIILMTSDILCSFGFKRGIELAILVLFEVILFLELYKYRDEGKPVLGLD